MIPKLIGAARRIGHARATRSPRAASVAAVAAFAHYVYGGLQPPGRAPSTRAAFLHLGIIGAVLGMEVSRLLGHQPE